MYGYVHLKNFKCYEDVEINLKDSRNRALSEIHFIGDNLSGKSSLLSAFSFFQEMVMLNYNHVIARKKKYCLRSKEYKLLCMERLVSKHRNYFSNNGLELEFEIIRDSKKYYYILKFSDQNKLIYESLSKVSNGNKIVLFERDQDTYSTGRGIVRVANKKKFDKYFEDNKDNFTLFSMLYFKIFTREIESTVDMIDMCSFILLHHINNDDHKHLSIFNFDKDNYFTLSKGAVSYDYIKVLQATAPVIKQLLNSISNDVDDVRYDVEEVEYGLFSYEMLVKQKRNNSTAWIKEDQWPPIYNMAIEFVDAMNDASFNGIVVLDNITDKLHYNTLKKILNAFNKYTTGQTIFSSNSSIYLNEVEHSSIFLLKNDSGYYIVENVVDVYNYRSEHNIRVRYEKGLYGTLNNKTVKSSLTLQEELDSEIRDYLNNLDSKFLKV